MDTSSAFVLSNMTGEATSSMICDESTNKNRLGLLRNVEGNLNVDKLYSLFQGNRESVEYFVGLWNAVNKLKNNNSEELDNYTHGCDPRDMKKRDNIKDWKLTVRFCSTELEVEQQYQSPESQIDALEPGVTYAAKQTVLEKIEGNWDENVTAVSEIGDGDNKRISCGVSGCGQVFTSLASYESHYHHCHRYVCDTCRRMFVSNFLLDIHLQENHDSYFAVLSPRIDMYRCLVESCIKKFRTPELRKDHLVSVHKIPSSFSFHQPIKENSVKSKQKVDAVKSVIAEASSSSNTGISSSVHAGMECEHSSSIAIGTTGVMDVESIVMVDASSTTNEENASHGESRRKGSSDGKRVPASICFGRGSQRAFHKRRGRGVRGRNWYQTVRSMETDTTVDIETVDMKELSEALT